MQLFFSKIFFILFLALFAGFSAHSQSASQYLLQRGDSLFQAGRFTEALPVYQRLEKQYGQYSPQMLLKMAFINEAKGDYAATLYYLNLHYNLKADRRVFDKMAELALKNNLRGYSFSDREYFIALFYNYQDPIIFTGYGMVLLLLILLIRSRLKKKEMGFTAVSLVFICAALLVLANMNFRQEQGIIHNDSVYLMEAPSPGSKLLETVEKGHRVEILDQQDVWSKILWQEQEAWVRSSNLLLIHP